MKTNTAITAIICFFAFSHAVNAQTVTQTVISYGPAHAETVDRTVTHYTPSVSSPVVADHAPTITYRAPTTTYYAPTTTYRVPTTT